MATALKPVGYDDRISVVDHLDELRTRLIISVGALVAAFILCFWQNHALLNLVGEPLKTTTNERTQEFKGPLGQIFKAQTGARTALTQNAQVFKVLSEDTNLSPASREALQRQIPRSVAAARALVKPPPNLPVTLGVGEPFITTATVAMYFSLLLAMPIILWQLYAFLLPAFSPQERRVAVPLMSMVPALFFIGVIFGYLVVLPAATAFLQNFNSDQYNVLVQAKEYYKFAAMVLLAMGLVFQLPAGILALSRLGVVNHRMLSKNRRYAILILTVVAAALPGVDPVSMVIELVPLLLLYEVSIVLARFFGKPIGEGIGSRFAWADDDDEDDLDEDEDDDDSAWEHDEDDDHRLP